MHSNDPGTKDATTRCGVIGHPISHSRSPRIHRAFAEQIRLALDYVLIDAPPEKFATRVKAFFTRGGHGLNVTLPHKAAAFELADQAGKDARQAGVANVLTRLSDGRLRADNVDGTGLVRDLACNLHSPLADRRILIVGAGGAAAGIMPALLDAGVSEAIITNCTRGRADALAQRLDKPRLVAISLDSLPDWNAFDLVINATSASLQGKRPTLPEAIIGKHTLAYDLVYADRATPFMEWADSLGARTADGRGMLIEQAADSFRIWHGTRPDTAPLINHQPN